MKTRDFYFDVPSELIAQHPPERRGDSQLMVLDLPGGAIQHSHVRSLGSFLPEGALLVFNNTKVVPARIHAPRRDSGGLVEFLLLEEADATGAATGRVGPGSDGEPGPGADAEAPQRWRCIVGKARRQRPGVEYDFPEGITGRVVDVDGEQRIVEFSRSLDEDYLRRHGEMPLPPYVKREAEAADSERYQTVYAEKAGSAAAPTAGLHFTEDMLEELRQGGYELRFLTLHVGLGTFSPVRAEEVESHEMHAEHYHIPRETAEAVNRAKGEGRPVIAVGTTSTRALESAWRNEDRHGGDRPGGGVRPGGGSTKLFIYPGYEFRAVDWLFTNFHTPGSSLVMMVSALTGRETLLSAYAEALRQRYRFFSYGDAMLIRRLQ